VSGAPGLGGLRQVDQTVGRLHDESRLWRGHRERLAGDTGCGGEPVTWFRRMFGIAPSDVLALGATIDVSEDRLSIAARA